MEDLKMKPSDLIAGVNSPPIKPDWMSYLQNLVIYAKLYGDDWGEFLAPEHSRFEGDDEFLNDEFLAECVELGFLTVQKGHKDIYRYTTKAIGLTILCNQPELAESFAPEKVK